MNKRRICLFPISAIWLLASSCSNDTELDVNNEFIPIEITYGAERLQALDIYTNDTCCNSPVIAFVHGGGWNSGDKRDLPIHIIEFFRKNGYIVVSLNYSLSPNPIDIDAPNQIRFPKHAEDIALGIHWIHNHIEEYGGSPTNINLIGHSAGAHLVCQVALSNEYLSAFGLIKSPISNIYLLDGGAYLFEHEGILSQRKDIEELIANAIGPTRPPLKTFWCNNLLNDTPYPDTNIFILHTNDSYRVDCNNAFLKSANELGLKISALTLNGLDHYSIVTHLPDFWFNTNTANSETEL